MGFSYLNSSMIKLKEAFITKAKLPLLLTGASALFAFGFLFGSRYWENGHAGPKKGTNVRVTGLCKVMGDIRYPPLQEAEVKLTNVSDKSISGVVRETAEPVDCELQAVNIDVLPLFSNFFTSPRPTALAKPGERIHQQKEVKEEYPYLNNEVWVTGVCDSQRGDRETLVDRVSEIISAKKVNEDWDLTVVAKDRKEAYN